MAFDLDRIHRRDVTGLAVGTVIELPDLDVEILALSDDGRPRAATFRFHVPLEHPTLRWLVVDPDPTSRLPLTVRTRAFELSAIGEELTIEGLR